MLHEIWENIFCHPVSGLAIPDRSGNGAYRLDASRLRVGTGGHWHICTKCRKVTWHNVAGICPSFRCDGTLQPVDCAVRFANDHYYRLYHDLRIRQLRVAEHTAQLDQETAYQYQKRFQRKQIDVLSCSTTFELGVDVGTLETVFMRNMPPSPANYAQRAGRAGRNKESAAYAVTFCTKSNHDFTFFREPEKMIKGKIKPPKFITENEKSPSGTFMRPLLDISGIITAISKRRPIWRKLNQTECADMICS
jgi:Zn-finger nucleic acid-binding protein